MVDLPSCASVDLYNERPDLMAIDEMGCAEIPQGWEDIRMFAPYSDKDNKVLNQALIDYHKKFVDLMLECKVDGIRADVARAKPAEFWDEIISYTRSKDPEFAYLAETYTYEDASPILNMPHDRPEELLAAGFDSYYGQYHLMPQWLKAKDLHDYVIENLAMSYRLPVGKSLIASFATHDDKSPMASGGAAYCNLTTGLGNTLPMTNPYYVTGFESGDTYDYDYAQKDAQTSNTDCFKYEVPHREHIDIFNLSRKPGGDDPSIGDFMTKTLEMRDEYKDIITKGSFIPLNKTNDKEDQIVAYARHLDGKTIVVVGNKNVNRNVTGVVKVPGLKENQELKNLLTPYGNESQIQAANGELRVNLGKARAHVFVVDTPMIEAESDKVYKQNL